MILKNPSASAIWAKNTLLQVDFSTSRRSEQVELWQEFFPDPVKWWDNMHVTSKHILSLERAYELPWLVPQLAMWDIGTRVRPGLVSDAVEGSPATPLPSLEAECRKLCEDGRVGEAVDALNHLVLQGHHVSNNLFYRLLRRCIAQKDLLLGSRVHAISDQSGYQGNAFLATHLIGLYDTFGMLEESMRVFYDVAKPSPRNWASIILACARHGDPAHAVGLYRQMRQSPVEPDNHIFVAVLKACAKSCDLAAGKEVHGGIRAGALQADIYVGTCLVDMYAKCGSLEDAQRLFYQLPQKNVVTWTAMISGYAQQGMGKEALRLYSNMQQEGITAPNSVTFVCLLQACASVGVEALQQGMQLHVQIEERGLQTHVVVRNGLINMYAKCGNLLHARRVFDMLADRNVVTWNSMIAGYALQGMGLEALNLYSSMQKEAIVMPNGVTFVCLLQACADLGVAALDQGKLLHAEFEKLGLPTDVDGAPSLINMYVKCGGLELARNLFDRLLWKDVATWTVMIAGYAQQGMGLEALSLYRSMQKEGLTPPDSVTFVCLLQACASVGVSALAHGKQLHVQIEERGLEDDVAVANSLVNMYAKCGSLQCARRTFDRLLQRDVITWNIMMLGYSQKGMGQEALSLYSSMLQEGISPSDSVTFVALLQACASIAALPLGKQVHAHIQERGLHADQVVGPCLVNMYAKCGSLEDAQQVFDSLPARDVVAWNALVSGYARLGDSDVVFQLVDRMQQDGALPNCSTFLGILTVCSHVGLVEKGRKYFQAMGKDYGLNPTIEHYRCMMDLLGRAGHLDEVLTLVETMPFQPDRAVWLTLLSACRKWSNIPVGQQAFESAVTLDLQDATPYVLMLNIYMSAQMWREAAELHIRRVKSGAWKQPGQSRWTGMDGIVHIFMVPDRTADCHGQVERRITCAAC